MKNIIIKYLNDSISSADLERLLKWLEKPKNQEKFKTYVKLNHELNSLNGQFEQQKPYQDILSQINVNGRKRLLPNLLKYAAILIGFSIIGYGLYQNSSQIETNPIDTHIVLQLEDGSTQILNENENTIISNSAGQNITEQKNRELVYSANDTTLNVLQYNTLKVPYGKTFSITLSDGSKVTLNSGSELKYPVQFIKSQENRTVYLNGEAFFDVAKNSNHPFIVNTKDMDVKVLGTQFNVTSYTKDAKTYAVLVEGKVSAHSKLSNEDNKTLSPNQKVFFENDQLSLETVNVEKYVGWVDGKLIFVNDSYEIIKNKLERKYNVSINNSYNALNDIIVTATFTNETIDEVLKTFQTYQAFNYNNKNGIVTITEPN